MSTRNTIQRDLVLKAVAQLGNHPNAETVYNHIIKEYPSISRGTVYRNLNILSQEGSILKIEVPGDADCYDHFCEDHYHVHCIKCGRVSDVDMEIIPDIKDRIKDAGGFDFLDYDIVFKGICPDCK